MQQTPQQKELSFGKTLASLWPTINGLTRNLMIKVLMKIALTCGAFLKMANGMIGLVIIMENLKQLFVKSFFNVFKVTKITK